MFPLDEIEPRNESLVTQVLHRAAQDFLQRRVNRFTHPDRKGRTAVVQQYEVAMHVQEQFAQFLGLKLGPDDRCFILLMAATTVGAPSLLNLIGEQDDTFHIVEKIRHFGVRDRDGTNIVGSNVVERAKEEAGTDGHNHNSWDRR